MALIVEDGSNIANADAFIEIADADTYHAAKGNSLWTGADPDKETAIRRATSAMNGFPWSGERSNGRSQTLSWPRSSVFDREDILIDNAEMPIEVINACAELALRELITPGALTPDVTRSQIKKKVKVGEIETEYENDDTSASASIPVMTSVEYLIGQFLTTGSLNENNPIFGKTERV